jgi:hypothetical protein
MPDEFSLKEEVVQTASNHLYHTVTLFSSRETSPPVLLQKFFKVTRCLTITVTI